MSAGKPANVFLARDGLVERLRAISRDELLSRVWGLDPRGMQTRTVDMAVARLREQLGDDPGNPAVIVTVRGKGYMLAGAGGGQARGGKG